MSKKMFSWTQWGAAGVLILAVVFSPTARADDAPAKPDAELNSADATASMSVAIQAAQLALEGERRHSPMLLLAAAELAGEIKPGTRAVAAVRGETSGKGDDKGAPLPELKPKALVMRAIEHCGDDEALKSSIESLGARLLSGERGIVYRQGKDLPKRKIGNTTFVIVNVKSGHQRLDPGSEYKATNVIFEAKKKAQVVVVGDGDGDLDLWVYDENSGGMIGKDTDTTSVCEVIWTPIYEGPFRIVVKNVGSTWEKFYVLANW